MYRKVINMDRPLKWHKFLIYFALWITALGYLISGASMIFVGLTEYVDNPFFQHPAVKTLNVVYGVIFIAYAVYNVYVRYQLARFRKDAPKKLLLTYILYPVLDLAYTPIALLVIGAPASLIFSAKFVGSIIGAVIAMAILCIPTNIYYNKRAELFIN